MGGQVEDSLFEDGWEEETEAPVDEEDASEDTAPATEDVEDRSPAAVVALADVAEAALQSGGDSPQVQALLAQSTAALADAGTPYTLTIVGPAIFRDRKLVHLDAVAMARSEILVAAVAKAGVSTIEIGEEPSESDLLSFAYAVERATHGDPIALRTLAAAGLRCGALPAPRAGGDGRKPDSELYAAAQVRKAQATTQQIAASPGLWPWPSGIDVIRRLELALNANAAGLLRALEIDDQPCTPPRAAVMAAGQCLLVLRSLGVAVPVRRAAAHALLNLCVVGVGPAGAADFIKAASEAEPRLLRTWSTESAGGDPPRLTPHHLKVCGLVHGIGEAGDPAACKGVARLLCLLYGLAAWRAEPGAQGRSLADLFALAMAEPGPGFDMPWLHAAMRANNLVPIGTGVQLDEGRFGLVMDPGRSGHPLKPLVQAGTQVSAAEQPVRPVAAG